MTDPLLATKLYIPQPRPRLVARSRLTARLDEALRLGRRLILVSAPAGFGKTTLLSTWLAGIKNRAAWLSLDEGDNDPARLLAYLVGALQSLEAGIGQDLLGALGSPQPPPMPALLTALLNELAAALSRDAPPTLLVLDDFHALTAPPTHQILTFLLEHLPPGLCLVVASRSDPPLPLARLRGRGQLTELRVADLRFSADEAAAFLHEVFTLDLAGDDVAALTARTEGWITGLQLAALSLQQAGTERAPQFIQDFAGSNRFVLDYLLEEVLEQQPEPVQRFLLQTSILDRLSGPLCDRVLEIGDGSSHKGQFSQYPISNTQFLSQKTLEQLEAANLFILPLDDERRWYRYHRLFADLLRARLDRFGPQLGCAPAGTLHRRASEWYEQNGLPDQAITHALAAHDLERAANLIEVNALPMLLRGELTALRRWLETLPDDVVRARPWLGVFHAWALTLSGRLEAAADRLQAAEAASPASPPDDRLGHVAAMRAYIAGQRGDGARCVEEAERALALLDADNLVVRSVVAFTLGGACLLRGDTAGAARAFAQASEMGQAAGNIHLAVPAAAHLADLEVQRGQLHRAFETYRRILDLAGPSPVAAQAHSGLGALLYEWNDLDAAERHLARSLELGKLWGNVEALSSDYAALAWLHHARGDAQRRDEALRGLEQLAHERSLHPRAADQVAAFQARLAVARGDLAAAERWLADSGLHADDDINPLNEQALLALAHVLLALGRADETARLLDRLLKAVERDGRPGSAVEILALRALAHQALAQPSRVMAALERALALAEPEGYVRTFVDLGDPLAELLAVADGEYVARLLAAFPKSHTPLSRFPDTRFPASPLVEPLSDRELEVLRLVAAGLTNREIADELVIALSTVKSHTNSIYGKLGVKNRTQAVAQARGLGLL